MKYLSKIKRRMLSAALALVMAAALMPAAVVAAPISGADLFASVPGTSFADVPAAHWAYDSVEKAVASGLLSGYGNGKYGPGDSVTNAGWAQMIVNLMGYTAENIRAPGNWWSQALSAALDSGAFDGTTMERGIRNGMTDDAFSNYANRQISRFDMAQVIYNIGTQQGWGVAAPDSISASVADWDSISPLYQNAVAYCYTNGFITGVDGKGTFDGNSLMNRAAAATVLCKLMDAKETAGDSTPLPAEQITPDASKAQTGAFILSPDGASYMYTLPEQAPKYNYADRVFSSSQEFRDIFISQYGQDKAVVYDMLAGVMTQLLYDDGIDFNKEVVVTGFEEIATVSEFSAASLAVGKDMPFLTSFIFCNFGGSQNNYQCKLSRYVINYFSPAAPNSNSTFIAMRDRVISELSGYRSAVAGETDDIKRLETAAALFNSGAYYDSGATYHGLSALLTKKGTGGSANWAFTMIGHAVDVPSFWLAVSNANHAVTLVKPNGGQLKVIDVTFSYSGQNAPKVTDVSNWAYGKNVQWTPTVLGFSGPHYFPDVDVFEHLGGLSLGGSAQPAPPEPAPAEPTPAEPTPAEPTPAEPTPAEPTPAEPTPAEPTPAEPTPAEPTPAEPTPAEPTPAEPTPAEPTPTVSIDDYRQQIFELTNAQRAKVGAAALKYNDDLSVIAQARAEALAALGSLPSDHVIPGMGGVNASLNEYRFGCTYAGENLTIATAPSSAITNWLNSPGHKSNMLGQLKVGSVACTWTDIGIGCAEGANGVYYWVQIFVQ